MATYTKHNLIPGKKVTIIADTPPDNFYFEKWAGSGASLEDETAETTIVTMGSISAYYRAIFKPNLSLTVNSIVIADNLKTGDQVAIDAGSPPVGYTFSSWSGDVSALDDVNSSTPTVTMGSSNVVLMTNFDEVTYATINYGALYNWYAATDARSIAASGWSVPSSNQCKILADYLGAGGNYTVNAVGGKIKETGIINWGVESAGATNEVGFNARGAGIRFSSFSNFKSSFVFILSDSSYYANIASTEDVFALANGWPKYAGASIRLIKDSTTLTHGQSGVYIGNDGKSYRTICIGTQEWLADNLAETKFRNGDWIPGFDGGVYTPISNAVWAALTSEAMCIFNNNLSNI